MLSESSNSKAMYTLKHKSKKTATLMQKKCLLNTGCTLRCKAEKMPPEYWEENKVNLMLVQIFALDYSC